MLLFVFPPFFLLVENYVRANNGPMGEKENKPRNARTMKIARHWEFDSFIKQPH